VNLLGRRRKIRSSAPWQRRRAFRPATAPWVLNPGRARSTERSDTPAFRAS